MDQSELRDQYSLQNIYVYFLMSLNHLDILGLIFGTGKQWAEQRKFSLQVFREFGFGKRKMENAIMEEVLELIQELKEKLYSSISNVWK